MCLCGGLVGLALGEWAGVGSRPIRLLWAGILVIIAAANLVGSGDGIVGAAIRAQRLEDKDSGQTEVLVQSLRDQVCAESIDVGENDSLHADLNRGVHVRLPVVDEEGFCRLSAEFFEYVLVNRGIRLGDAQLIAPDQNIESARANEIRAPSPGGSCRPCWRRWR